MNRFDSLSLSSFKLSANFILLLSLSMMGILLGYKLYQCKECKFHIFCEGFVDHFDEYLTKYGKMDNQFH